jgi:hypothetical protein
MAAQALLAGTAGPAYPRNANPPLCAVDDSDDLVPEDSWGMFDLYITVD